MQLIDKHFLQKLYKQKNIKSYMKIYLLNFDETPKEIIEGKTSTCNINLDGNSAIRRTCSIGITGVKDMKIHKTWWGINSKIKVEIGIVNELDDTYPEVIWLPLGLYLIDSFSYSENVTNVSINITGKDKIAQLNGMSGGYFGQTVVLDKIEVEDEEGIISTQKLPIKDIIKDMMNLYGGEPLHNLQIEDLDSYGLNMLKYTGSEPYYLVQPWQIDKGEVIINDINDPNYGKTKFMWKFVTLDPNRWLSFTNLNSLQANFQNLFYLDDKNFIMNNENIIEIIPNQGEPNVQDYLTELGAIQFSDKNIDSDILFNTFEQQSGLGIKMQQPIFIDVYTNENKINIEAYSVYKISQGDIAGYSTTDLVYSDDLIAQPTDTVTNILDKIKKFFGDTYEYFYDIYGKFHFRKKIGYQQISYNPYDFYLDNNVVVAKNNENISLSIEDKELITEIKFTPSLENIKNDFIIWGQKGENIPICLRYAIDIKPKTYQPIRKDKKFNSSNNDEKTLIINSTDINESVDQVTGVWVPIDSESTSIIAKNLYDLYENYLDGNTAYNAGLIQGQPNPAATFDKQIRHDETTKEIKHTVDGYTQLIWQGGINNYFNQTVVMMAAQISKEQDELEGKNNPWELQIYNIGKNYQLELQFSVPVHKISGAINGTKDKKYIKVDITCLDKDKKLYNYFNGNNVNAFAQALQNSYYNWYYTKEITNSVQSNIPVLNGDEVIYKYENVTYLGNIRVYVTNKGEKYINIRKNTSHVFNNSDYIFDSTEVIESYRGKYLYINNRYYKIVKVEQGGTAFTRNNYRIYFSDPYNFQNEKLEKDVWVCKLIKENSNSNNHQQENKLSTIISKAQNVVECSEVIYNDITDWRELIYQMALDYRACGQHDDYAYILQKYNPWCKNGKTGYEQYYSDLLEFWPQYYRKQGAEKITTETKNGIETKTITRITIADWNYENLQDLTKLKYWLEFVGEGSELENISSKNIGIRSNIAEDENIKNLYDVPIPGICYIKPDQNNIRTVLAYPYYQMEQNNPIWENLVLATYDQAAINTLNTSFFNSIKNKKTLDITMIPYYNLDVNGQITVNLPEDNISGHFMVEKISYNLSNNFTMTISATEIVKEY